MNVLHLVLVGLMTFPLAAGAQASDEQKKGGEPDLSAFGGWKPQPVTNPPEKEVRDFLQKMESLEGGEAFARVVSFPVLMVTTDAEGVASAGPMDREQFVQTMTMPPEAQAAAEQMQHGKPELHWITPSLVFVTTPWWMGEGEQKLTWTSGMLLVKEQAGWRVKTLAEGGWADVGAPQEGGEAAQGH